MGSIEIQDARNTVDDEKLIFSAAWPNENQRLYECGNRGESGFRLQRNFVIYEENGTDLWSERNTIFINLNEYFQAYAQYLPSAILTFVDADYATTFTERLFCEIKNGGMACEKDFFRMGDGISLWLRWSKFYQEAGNSRERSSIIVRNFIKEAPVTKVDIDPNKLGSFHGLLNLIFIAMLSSFLPPRTYGIRWLLLNLRSGEVVQDSNDFSSISKWETGYDSEFAVIRK